MAGSARETEATMMVSPQVARRFIMGKQGLWPGRRWSGREGVQRAIDAAGSIQVDPLDIGARSHDIALWGRVQDYQPDDLNSLLYESRSLFDYGGNLQIYPMKELPYWVPMMRRKVNEGRSAAYAAEHPELIQEVRQALRDRGPLANRDFTGRALVHSYRGRKDTGPALFYLWLTGELMTYGRRGFERLYHFREHVAPADLQHEVSEAEAEAFFARKVFTRLGMARERDWAACFSLFAVKRLNRVESLEWLEKLMAAGEAAAVTVEGNREIQYVAAGDLPLLRTLAEGGVPAEWQPMSAATTEEAVFLAPLDVVSSCGRAAKLFGFEYIWEVYKPAHLRRWGYYTLPVLYGDALVARIEPRLDRATGTLRVLGFWPEDTAILQDEAFVSALGRGLSHFARLVRARTIDASGMEPACFRQAVLQAAEIN